MTQYIFLGFFTEAITRTVLVIAVFMTFFFLCAAYKKRNDIADVVWGLGFIAVAWFNFYIFGFQEESQLFAGLYGPVRTQVFLVALTVTIWGIRLAVHIGLRIKDKEEDFRYKKCREDWGSWAVARSYLQVFLLQGFFMLLISLPIIAVSVFGSTTISWITVIGFLIWFKGFIFEAGGDYQLSRFMKNPDNKGKIMKQGFWAYTRHPNYFGEVTQWWGIYIMSLPITLSTLQATWYIWAIALLGPITITFLILKVSGIPMLEKKYKDNPEFEEYKKTTNAFIPWFPKKVS